MTQYLPEDPQLIPYVKAMQSPQQQTSQPLPPPSGSGEPVVNPTPESRLDQLAARYSLLKPQADETAEQLKEITDAIKAELAQLLPSGATSILLTSPHLLAPLRLKNKTGWRIDAKSMKTQDPGAYVNWAVPTSSWELKAAG